MNIVAYDPTDWADIQIPKFRCVDRAWKFLKKHGFRRLPADRERVFLKSPSKCVDYAAGIQSRLPAEYEMVIITQPKLALDYFQKVVRGRVPEYEHIFRNQPALLVEYSKTIIRGRLPEEMESWLMGDPHSCFEYAWQILDGRLPEVLHNYMFGANLETTHSRKYRGYNTKLEGYEEYCPDYSNPKEYFEFIKWQRTNLCRMVLHYANMYGVDTTKTISEFLYELKNGR